MLSRVAESLYWIGRYVERAEDTARLLDVHVQTVLEDPWIDEAHASRDLLSIMGVKVPRGTLTSQRTTDLLAFAPGSTSSIVGALAGARENARGVREALSSELWECLNATYHALSAQQSAAQRQGPHAFFRFVRERAAVVSGLLDGTMPRDDGWRFLVLGRSLERVDMTARLVWARAGRGSAVAGWVGLLKSCSAHEAYLRTYRAAVEPERVLEFLVVDRLFPRSIYSALAQAEICLSDLDPISGRAGIGDEARRLLGRARTELEFTRSDELAKNLPEVLDMLQRTCSEAGVALSSKYFHRATMSWASEIVQ